MPSAQIMIMILCVVYFWIFLEMVRVKMWQKEYVFYISIIVIASTLIGCSLKLLVRLSNFLLSFWELGGLTWRLVLTRRTHTWYNFTQWQGMNCWKNLSSGWGGGNSPIHTLYYSHVRPVITTKVICQSLICVISGASRISPRWGANPPGAPTYDLTKFSQKLHEIERIWTPMGGVSLAPPFTSANLFWRLPFRNPFVHTLVIFRDGAH